MVREEILAEERQLKGGARKAMGQDWKDCLPGEARGRRASSEAVLGGPSAKEPALGAEGTAHYMWSILLRYRWRYRRAEWESLAEEKIAKVKAGLIYMHRTCRVLKKPGQYQVSSHPHPHPNPNPNPNPNPTPNPSPDPYP